LYANQLFTLFFLICTTFRFGCVIVNIFEATNSSIICNWEAFAGLSLEVAILINAFNVIISPTSKLYKRFTIVYETFGLVKYLDIISNMARRLEFASSSNNISVRFIRSRGRTTFIPVSCRINVWSLKLLVAPSFWLLVNKFNISSTNSLLFSFWEML